MPLSTVSARSKADRSPLTMIDSAAFLAPLGRPNGASSMKMDFAFGVEAIAPSHPAKSYSYRGKFRRPASSHEIIQRQVGIRLSFRIMHLHLVVLDGEHDNIMLHGDGRSIRVDA